MKNLSRKYDRKREEMVRSQIEARGVKDPLVLSAFRTVPRHLFVSEALRDQASKYLPDGEIIIQQITPVLGANLGIGALGFAGIAKKK